MRKLYFIFLFTFLSLSSLFAQENILLIIADDLGVDQVGYYGENGNAANTPIIDALAAEGVIFRNAWSNPVCSPTRAGIYTGRHGFRTGIGNVVTTQSSTVLSLDEFTIAEAVTETHRTALIGKWHVGNDLNGGADGPNLAGWDYYAGLLSGALSDYYLWERTEQGLTEEVEGYATTIQVDDAIHWISQQTEPWFCTLAFTAPHTPFHAPPEDLHTVTLPDVDPDDDPAPFYKAAVEAMDTEIGRLLDALGDDRANTTIIFIGDNGTPRQVVEDPITPDKAKGTVYEGGVNIPFIVNGPAVGLAQGESGFEVDYLVHTVDIYATIYELTGGSFIDDITNADPTTTWDSQSLVPLLNGTGSESPRIVYTEVFDDTTDLAAVRNSKYKIIYDAGGISFYNLENDPYETNNLMNRPFESLPVPAQRNYANLMDFLESMTP